MNKTLDSFDIDPVNLIKEAVNLVDLVSSWDAKKTYSFKLDGAEFRSPLKVQTFNKNISTSYWSARTTSFNGKSFTDSQREDIWQYFSKYLIGEGASHTVFEQEYIHELESFKEEEVARNPSREVSDFYSFHSYAIEAIYKLQFPLKKRVFYELVLIYKNNTDENEEAKGYVVSIPIEPKLFNNKSSNLTSYVLARYASVEKVVYNKQKGTLNWTMCTRSSPGGNIPDFIANMSINGVISKDVPSFLNWAAKKN